jgi:F-type H+-transporting ATPase subunit a
MMARDEKRAKRTFPLVFTMFLFILLANLFTFLPGAAAITSGDIPLFRAVTSDYGLVFVLTIIALVVVQVVAIVTNGPFGYLKQFIDVSSPLNFILGVMNLIGEIAKILSLSFRLFGNMFAAEVLGAVMLFLMPFFIPLPFMFLGLITAIIQAVVLLFLLLYLSLWHLNYLKKKELPNVISAKSLLGLLTEIAFCRKRVSSNL